GCVRLSRESVCTAFTPPSFLSTYIRMQKGLVEAGLEFIGDDQETILGPLEGFRGLRLRKAIHIGFGVGMPAVVHGARKSHERLKRIPALGKVFVDGELVAHRMQARSG